MAPVETDAGLRVGTSAVAVPVGQLVRERRQAMRPRLSRAKLARAVGITEGYLRRVERGETRPPAPLLLAIAERLYTHPLPYVHAAYPLPHELWEQPYQQWDAFWHWLRSQWPEEKG